MRKAGSLTESNDQVHGAGRISTTRRIESPACPARHGLRNHPDGKRSPNRQPRERQQEQMKVRWIQIPIMCPTILELDPRRNSWLVEVPVDVPPLQRVPESAEVIPCHRVPDMGCVDQIQPGGVQEQRGCARHLPERSNQPLPRHWPTTPGHRRAGFAISHTLVYRATTSLIIDGLPIVSGDPPQPRCQRSRVHSAALDHVQPLTCQNAVVRRRLQPNAHEARSRCRRPVDHPSSDDSSRAAAAPRLDSRRRRARPVCVEEFDHGPDRADGPREGTRFRPVLCCGRSAPARAAGTICTT